MDDCMAAMVLMSLSCSPKSPLFTPDGVTFSQSWSSFDSGLTTNSTASRTTTPSPPTIYSQTPNIDEYVQIKRSTKRVSSCDEGIEIDENLKFEEDLEDNNQQPQRILFQCTWRGCIYISESCQEIERHVRVTHLGRSDQIVEDENSDHEEEFYYTEIELDANSPSPLSNSSLTGFLPSNSLPKFNSSYISQSPNISPGPLVESDSAPFFASSSAPTWSHLDMAKPPTEDPEYKRYLNEKALQMDQQHQQQQQQQKQQTITIKTNLTKLNGQKCHFISNPINIPGISFAQHYANSSNNHSRPLNLSSPKSANYSNGNKIMRLSVNSKSGTTLLQSPNKLTTVSPTRRTRGETRKCRKMYGMEKRDAWCTQCKWKKACTRFVD